MNKGFSLIEVLIVVAIATSIVFVVSNINGNISGLNNLVSQQLQSKSDIVQTLQIITSEVRSAGPSQNGGYPIESASTSSLVFFSDINKDGTMERVRYFFATSSLNKGITEPTGTLATYVTSTEIVTNIVDNVILPTSTSLFAYYDGSYTGSQTPLSTPINISQIRIVGITFYADVKPAQAPTAQFFSTFVDIRNLRSN